MLEARVVSLVCAFLMTLPVFTSAGQISDRLEQVFGIFTDSPYDQEFLEPDVAFVMSTDILSGNEMLFRWQIADGYYLYRDNFRFQIPHGEVALGKAVISRGKVKEDPDFGSIEVLRKTAEVRLPLTRINTDVTSFDVAVTYQGCKEDVICYPPVNKTVNFVLPTGLSPTARINELSVADEGLLSEQDAITERLADSGFLFNVLAFLGFGLLLAFTPCVFPMVPILSGIIVGQGVRITTKYAFLISSSYVLAMACTYAILGIIAGSFKFNLQAAAQNIWVIIAFSGIFVLLALSMFGFYELQLPESWRSRLSAVSDKQKGGTLKGAAVMGILSAIIVGPCVAPPLAGALLYISQTGNAILGGSALLAMGLGMGIPLLVIGTSAGKLLPRVGSWMESIQRAFGVIMLGVAIWFIERIVPGPVALVLWALLLIVTSVYLGALDKLEKNAGWQRLWKGVGLVMLVYGAALIIGAAGGSENVFRPLHGISFSTENISKAKIQFKSIKSVADLDSELMIAGRANQVVMLDFYADWCITCKEMEAQTFHEPRVQDALREVVLLQADVTANDELDKTLLEKFNLIGPPAILFFGRDGEERRAFRLIGFVDADQFTQHVRRVTAL